MSGVKKILENVLRGTTDNNVSFEGLCLLMRRMNFSQRIKGSHYIFCKDNVEEIINLQRGQGGKAKPYQVKQIRNLILKYKLGGQIK